MDEAGGGRPEFDGMCALVVLVVGDKISPAPPAGVGDGRDCPMLLPVLTKELGGMSKISQAPLAGNICWHMFPGLSSKFR